MVDVPIHQEDLDVQRTLIIDPVISMVTDKTASTPTPPTTQAHVQMYVPIKGTGKYGDSDGCTFDDPTIMLEILSRRFFLRLNLPDHRSPDFDLFSDQEEYSEEEVAETMAETMEQYMSKTRADYGLGIAKPKIEDKDSFELKGQFLKELRDNTFSGSDHEDSNKHIENVLKIVDLFHIPNITIDQVMLRAFPMSLTGAASRWLRNKPSGSITT
ncbi:hypothetical protein Tco_1023429 [Tanacetum coccineum]